jgi:hypothetical protein
VFRWWPTASGFTKPKSIRSGFLQKYTFSLTHNYNIATL